MMNFETNEMEANTAGQATAAANQAEPLAEEYINNQAEPSTGEDQNQPEGNYANLEPALAEFQHEFDGADVGSSMGQPPNGYEPFGSDEEIVQVVYQSDQDGTMVGVESSLLGGVSQQQQQFDGPHYATVEPRNNRLGANEFAIQGEQLIDFNDQVAEDNIGGTYKREESAENIQEDIGHILTRHSKGAAESGSFRQNNFRKKLGLSVSTNENDLTAHRQKFLESREAFSNCATVAGQDTLEPVAYENQAHGDQHNKGSNNAHKGGQSNLGKFKRTHSVSFNMSFSRSNRHSVDIRNLPSYLTHKRASIVDVARGAMSSLISSLSGGGESGSGAGGQRRDSSATLEEEPIFEEPIAPTLSLGQRVALVRQSGAEFGTVGWIGQLADIDDDWIVGVIFDNMIGNCDGAYNGTRYFYARENYAMFVPLSLLTKTDNYIGRPETGTMLSRMSISLKPGQLISIQRSSIRLQHCFLNAPHQRVGHDVRAVSNRLHCQCHNCGPCAHLTKQGRAAHTIPHFGAKHLSHHKKNSLAHAAVELLAHHHHHFHDEEEEHEEKDCQFGDNAAHACNYVRYSCCQQTGLDGHEFLNDCGMVRPELLDNLIHAPKAPHKRSRPRRQRAGNQGGAICGPPPLGPKAVEAAGGPGALHRPLALIDPSLARQQQLATLEASNQSWTQDGNTTNNNTIQSSSWLGSETTAGGRDADGSAGSSSYSSSCSSVASSSSSNSLSSSRSLRSRTNHYRQQAAGYVSAEIQFDASTYRPTSGNGGVTTAAYNTMDSQYSIMDQRRFIYQRDSAAMVRYQPSYLSDDQVSQTGASCFNCFRRKHRRKTGRTRKLSAKDRLLEYRRRQSTFVPSTLAKPQDDFASHGIILPSTSTLRRNNNSDYSSDSRSSASSPDSQPGLDAIKMDPQSTNALDADQRQQQKQMLGNIEYGAGDYNGYMKSSQAQLDHSNGTANINYTDYSFDDRDTSLKKRDSSRDSALTDLGYWDTNKTDSSSDTLKQLVDQSINEQISLPGIQEDLMVSPILSFVEEANPASEQFEISSPTVSLVDYNANEEIRQGLDDLTINSGQYGNQDTNANANEDGDE